MTYHDYGEARGPYETSPEAQALGEWQIEHHVIYRGHDKGLGYEHLLRGESGYGQVVPAYEPWPGMDRGLFWNGSDY